MHSATSLSSGFFLGFQSDALYRVRFWPHAAATERLLRKAGHRLIAFLCQFWQPLVSQPMSTRSITRW
jgi:hypothetical protein